MEILLDVLGLDSYGWLVVILLALVTGQSLAVAALFKAYNETKSRLHVVTTDSITAYQRITEAMNYIRQDINNFTTIAGRGSDTIHKAIETRLDRVDRVLEDIQRDILRK
jgi:hypothetical protein